MNVPMRKAISVPRANFKKPTPTVTIAGISISLCASEKEKCAKGERCGVGSECNLFALPQDGAICKKLHDNVGTRESSGPKTLLKDVVPTSHPAYSSESKDWVTPGTELQVVKTTSYENICPNIPKGSKGCPGERHPGLRCGVCGGGIVGYRYKCVTCAHYDLCAACEARGAHAHHVVMRFPRPIKFQTARELILAWCELLKAKGLLSPYEKPKQRDWKHKCSKTVPLAKSAQTAMQGLGKNIKLTTINHREKKDQSKKHEKPDKIKQQTRQNKQTRGKTNICHKKSAESNADSGKMKTMNNTKSLKSTGTQKYYLGKKEKQSRGGTEIDSLKHSPNIEENQKHHTKLIFRHLKTNVIRTERKNKNTTINKDLRTYLKNIKNKLFFMKPMARCYVRRWSNGKRNCLAARAEVAPRASSPKPNKPSGGSAVNIWCDDYDTTVPRPPTIKTYSRPKAKPAAVSDASTPLSSSLPTNCEGVDRVQPDEAGKEYDCANETAIWIKKEFKMEIVDNPNGDVLSCSMLDLTEPTAVRIKEEPDPL